ncbi:DUF7309 domain-containing protein [Paenibacillus sp. sgz302251]|uniref:DUF7309 domain-containing protein n=1 Tax=Paenibacillus sp. sgz302251 TaxID=3414493 RepID=UPI003C7A94DF
MLATNEQWTRLYETALAFKAAQPWKQLDNSHLFGIKDPDSDLTGYCCVMGAGGELYGLALYFGKAGLNTVIDMLNGDSHGDPMFIQHCLMLSFDDREDLQPEERNRIKDLGFKFRGRGAWPSFKLHEPGYYPWPIKAASDVVFLTYALEQTLHIALEASEEPDSYFERVEGKIPTLLADRQADNSLHWKIERLLPEEDQSGFVPAAPQPIDELQLAKVRKSLQGQGGIWEIGCFFMPTPVGDRERPYFPMIMLLVDQQSNQILVMELFDHLEASVVIPKKLLDFISSSRVVPSQLLTSDPKLLNDLKAIAKSLKIPTHLANAPLLFDEVKESLIHSMLARN